MLTPEDIDAFKEKVKNTKKVLAGHDSNSVNDRDAFIDDVTKQGFFSGNPKPGLVIDLTVPDASGESIFFRTWQELCNSDAWFYGAVCRPMATRQFMFCFASGVYVRAGKTQGNSSDGFIDYEEFEKAIRPEAWKSPRPWKFKVDNNFIHYKKRLGESSLYSTVVHTIKKNGGREDVSFGLLFDFIRELYLKQEQDEQAKQRVKIAEEQAKRAKTLSARYSKEISVLKNKLQSKVDKDANGEVDLIESSVFMDAVKTHQKEIQAINPDFVKNFVKLENNLKTRRTTIESIYAYAMKFKLSNHSNDVFEEGAKNDLADWKFNKQFLMGEMKAYTAVQYNAIHMVNALLNDDMITFYEIYEAFDQLELWHSQYEKVSTAQLKSLNDNIRSLIRTTEESTNRIVDGLGDLTYRMAEQNDNLKKIHGAVTAGNLLSVINTFQLHRISKNTRSLRE